MEKKIIYFGKICLLSAGVMASAAMLTGCSQDVAAPAAGSGDGTRVEVTASFLPSENAALTRAADGLDDSASGFSLLTSEDDASKVRVMVDKNDGSYAAFDYGITSATAIEAPATAPTFPSAVNSVNVYGWYPAKSLSGFSVAGDQSGEADYCLSDLMCAVGTTCTREGTTVSPAALSFEHVMSKVKVSLTLAAGVTVKTVKLKNVKPTVTVSATTSGSTVTGYSLGEASGDAGDITLLSGGLLTSTSAAAAKVLCGVFPPQSISDALLEITANYNDGDDQTITYSLEDAKTFATNKEYTMNISLNRANIVTGTVMLTGWDATSGVVNVLEGSEAPTLNKASVTIVAGSYEDVTASVVGTAWAGISANPSIATVSTVDGKIRITGVSEGSTNVYIIPTAGVTGGFSSAVCEVTVVGITAMKPDALSSNPLWKVAQYNVAKGGTSFVTSHSTASQYVFSWADAKDNISIPGYHLPTWAEQVKIIPSTKASGGGTDWFNTASSTPAAMNSITGTGNTQEKGWYIKSSAKNNVYAVRIVGGVLTAWHYQWVTSPCRGLQIDSYVLAYQHTGDGDTWTDAEMQAILALLPSSSVWTTAAANLSPESPSSTSSRCTRFLPACGNTDSTDGSGVATMDCGNYGYYWSATTNGDSNAFRWYFSSSNLLEYYYALGSGFSVRLFQDD